MVKTITITDEAYEKLKELKEKMGMSFSETISYLLRRGRTNWEVILKYLREGIKIDEKTIKEMRKRWKKRLLSLIRMS